MPTTFVNNGRLITATDEYVADMYIEGEKIKAIGSPAFVLSHGKVMFAGDEFKGRPGDGQFLKRSSYALP